MSRRPRRDTLPSWDALQAALMSIAYGQETAPAHLSFRGLSDVHLMTARTWAQRLVRATDGEQHRRALAQEETTQT